MSTAGPAHSAPAARPGASSWASLALEYFGAVTGAAGAGLLALNIALSPWAWVIFLLSNVAWIAYGLRERMRGLLLMQLVFTAISLLGIWRALLPLLAPPS